MGYLLLSAAIVSEVIGTLSLKASDGFTKPAYTALVVVGYLAAFALLAVALRQGMSLGVAYAIWAAVGVAGVAMLSVPIFGETLSVVQGVGIAFVVAGVAAIASGGAH